VSAIVCGHLFLLPMVRRMMGLNEVLPKVTTARLTTPLGANGPRAHYMRARLSDGQVTAFERQDSALLSVLTEANALALRPPHDGPRQAGDSLHVLPL